MSTKNHNVYEWEDLAEPAPTIEPTADSAWQTNIQAEKAWKDEMARLVDKLEALKAKIDPDLRKQIEELEREIGLMEEFFSISQE